MERRESTNIVPRGWLVRRRLVQMSAHGPHWDIRERLRPGRLETLMIGWNRPTQPVQTVAMAELDSTYRAVLHHIQTYADSRSFGITVT